MNANIVVGDIVSLAKEGHFDVLIHGAHCFNYMGHGVADSIAKAFPLSFDADMATAKGDKGKMGTYSYAVCESDAGHPLVVINGYTQYNYGVPHYQSKAGFDYTSFDGLCQRIHKRLGGRGLRFGYPLIGGDRGNAEHRKVLAIMERHFAAENRTLVLYNEPGRKKKYAVSDFDFLLNEQT